MPKRKTASQTQAQPRKRAGRREPRLETISEVPPSASITDGTVQPINCPSDVQATAPTIMPTNVMPPYQLQDLAQRISTILSEREDPAQPQGTEGIPSSNANIRVSSYDNDLGHNVSNNIKLKIANGEYVNLASLINNKLETDPHDDTRYFSLQNGNLALSSKSKLKPITDVQMWTDAFLVYAAIYVLARPMENAALFKYIHTIRLGASRVNGLGWRDYDIQFRLKKECNPSMSFASVDQELWLLYMYNNALHRQPAIQPSQPLKCYDFNYKGYCSRQNCQYRHWCILCSQPHPFTMCRTTTRNSLNFRSGNSQSTWRAQSTVKPATSSFRTPSSTPVRHQ
ncbi:uncharacterized protein LOC133178174 [Saccostrea echinata]|uniref:uncharacterized protein LOC133178174 n=1 Tax=Saccostrea echinata TaxID=191078 RepID=UPI002A822314|nr:uncharacterized protein LOC133178174 [Saccostrea echinata]